MSRMRGVTVICLRNTVVRAAACLLLIWLLADDPDAIPGVDNSLRRGERSVKRMGVQ